jgi:hypothetical protein
VSDVWISGEERVRDGELVAEAFSGLDTRWRMWQNALAAT